MTFQIIVLLMTIHIHSQMKPNEQKIHFQGIAHVFLALTQVFVSLNAILVFFLRFY